MRYTARATFFSLFTAATCLQQAAHAEQQRQGNTPPPELIMKMEKCYGVARAGRNDCANATGTHQCASYSLKDSDPAEWVMVPAGTCARLVGGSDEPEV